MKTDLVVARSSRRLLGAHVVSEQSFEIIHLTAARMLAEMRIEQLAEMEIACPTFSAAVGIAARRIVSELGMRPPAPEWRRLKRRPAAEWERRDSQEI